MQSPLNFLQPLDWSASFVPLSFDTYAIHLELFLPLFLGSLPQFTAPSEGARGSAFLSRPQAPHCVVML